MWFVDCVYRYWSKFNIGTSRLFCSPGWWRRSNSSFLARNTRSSLGGEKGRREGGEKGKKRETKKQWEKEGERERE